MRFNFGTCLSPGAGYGSITRTAPSGDVVWVSFVEPYEHEFCIVSDLVAVAYMRIL